MYQILHKFNKSRINIELPLCYNNIYCFPICVGVDGCLFQCYSKDYDRYAAAPIIGWWWEDTSISFGQIGIEPVYGREEVLSTYVTFTMLKKGGVYHNFILKEITIKLT